MPAIPGAACATVDLGAIREHQGPYLYHDVAAIPCREGPGTDDRTIYAQAAGCQPHIPRPPSSPTICRERCPICEDRIRRDPQVEPQARAVHRFRILRKYI